MEIEDEQKVEYNMGKLDTLNSLLENAKLDNDLTKIGKKFDKCVTFIKKKFSKKVDKDKGDYDLFRDR